MLKIAYLGERFSGFARQPGLQTVEGDLLKAFNALGYNPKIYPASRTDRGVTALCNVVRVNVKGENLCRMLTGNLKDIWVYGYTFEEWNPRHGIKHYVYALPGDYDIKELRKCCSLFSGVHDFQPFTRARGRNTVKEIEVSFEVKENVVLFHFRGKSFLWEMVRRCVTGMGEYLSGKKTEEEVAQLLGGGIQEGIPPAPAENLLLLDICYESDFLTDEYSLKRMKKELYTYFEMYSAKKALLEECIQ